MIKITFILILMSFFACNSNKEAFDEKYPAEKDKPGLKEYLVKDFINNLTEDTVYLNLVSNEECFSCSPVYSNVAQIMEENPEKCRQVVYVFPAVRPILYQSFINNNFHQEYDSSKYVFNDDLYAQLRQFYELQNTSNLICLDKNHNQIYTVPYQKTNTEDFERYLR
jgi:thioredoxin-related protein